jgi:hypothetical protein
MGEKGPVKFSQAIRNCRDLSHGTDGFTSPPKEGMLRIFTPEKSDGFSRVTAALDYTIYNSMALVRERTIPTERPPPVGKVSANFCG